MVLLQLSNERSIKAQGKKLPLRLSIGMSLLTPRTAMHEDDENALMLEVEILS